MAVNIDGRLMALDMRIQTNVLKNRKFAHLRLDHRREALKIVEIIGSGRTLSGLTKIASRKHGLLFTCRSLNNTEIAQSAVWLPAHLGNTG